MDASSTTDVEKRERKIPRWVWFVGGGCAALILVAAMLAAGLWMYIDRLRDPERQWPAIAKVLPYDVRPANFSVFRTPNPIGGAEIWMLTEKSSGEQILIMHYSGAEVSKERERLFETREISADVPWVGKVGRFDVEAGKLEVQGRELECVRSFSRPKEDEPERPDENAGIADKIRAASTSSSLTVNVTPPGSDELVAITMTRIGHLKIPDQAMVDFLRPFHIGPDRR